MKELMQSVQDRVEPNRASTDISPLSLFTLSLKPYPLVLYVGLSLGGCSFLPTLPFLSIKDPCAISGMAK